MLLLHEGGTQNAPFSRGFMDVNKCENFTGLDLLDIVNRLDPAVDLVVSAHTHQPYVCRFNNRLVTSAASFGRLITSIDVTIDRRAGKMVDVTAENARRDADGARRMRAQRRSSRGTRRSPTRSGTASSARITADIHSARGTVNGTNAAGEQPMGDVIADAMYEAAHPSDFGGAVAAFMNVGGVRASLLFNQISGGEQPGEVTYAEAFAVQPFGNTLVVKTCTGQQLYDVLEQQFENPAAGQQRVMAVSQVTYSYTRRRPSRAEARPGRFAEDRRRHRRQGGRLPGRAEQLHRGRGRRIHASSGRCTAPLGGDVDVDAFAALSGGALTSRPAAAEPDHAARLRHTTTGGAAARCPSLSL